MDSQKSTRRDVLKGGCAAMVGMAVPYVITSTALGNKNKLPASERVTLAHIGTGGRGTYLLNCCQGPRTQSIAVADCYADRREVAAATIVGKGYVDFC